MKQKIPLTPEEIINGNKLMAYFLGYTYFYKGHDDFSDCGGLYSDVEYYSKVPLEFDFIHENGAGEEILNRDADYITIRTGGYYIDNVVDELQYHLQFNWLMPVCKKCFDVVEELEDDEHWYRDCIWYSMAYCDIEKIWKSTVEFIEKYNKAKNTIS